MHWKGAPSDEPSGLAWAPAMTNQDPVGFEAHGDVAVVTELDRAPDGLSMGVGPEPRESTPDELEPEAAR